MEDGEVTAPVVTTDPRLVVAREVAGATIEALVGLFPFLLPLQVYWAVMAGRETRQRFTEIESEFQRMRASDGEFRRRMELIEEAVSTGEHGRSEVQKRDVRMAFEAVYEGIVADDDGIVADCVRVAAHALAGRIADQAEVAAVWALGQLTPAGLSLLRQLHSSRTAGEAVELPAEDTVVADGLVALGLMQRTHHAVAWEGSGHYRLNHVGTALVRLTAS
ncbi:MAG: hypothetical protein KTR31_02665 [Myxococcales bacterium]|nr:hypothetical protein [Myxococcales bacterium]